MMTFVLKLMEELDKYDYNKALHCCSVEGLYAKIFVRQHGSNVHSIVTGGCSSLYLYCCVGGWTGWD